jgi:hypothetical protein
MFGLDMLDVMIGLVTVYLSFGIACTAFVEAISSIAGLRSRNLRNGLNEFFKGAIKKENGEETSFAKAFYEHPLVMTLSKGDKGRPSYIPTEIVGRVVVSLLNNCDTADSLKAALEALPGEKPGDNRVKDLLLDFYAQTKGEVIEFRKKVEAHFDLSMERVAGWFKRYTQYVAIGVSIVLVGFANVDSIDIARSLSANPEVRAALVQSAGKILTQKQAIEAQLEKPAKPDKASLEAATQKVKEAQAAYDNSVSKLEQTGLTLGWEKEAKEKIDWFAKVVGLFVSALAVSLGAPFWFQILQRFMQIRGSGATPKKNYGTE